MQHTYLRRNIICSVMVSALIFAGYDLAFAKSAKSNKRASAQTRKQTTKSCNQCEAAAVASRKRGVKARASASSFDCHPRGYVHPSISGNLNSAMRELRRDGIRPVVTSAWRSSAKQAALHNCAKSSRCRLSHGVYGAKPAGSSLHEAGFAVDIAGIATGPRGSRRLTPRGRRIVQVMNKHGFAWRYGLSDPPHFEANPTRHGFRSVKQAIKTSQTRCSVNLVAKSRPASKSRASSKRMVSKTITKRSARKG